MMSDDTTETPDSPDGDDQTEQIAMGDDGGPADVGGPAVDAAEAGEASTWHLKQMLLVFGVALLAGLVGGAIATMVSDDDDRGPERAGHVQGWGGDQGGGERGGPGMGGGQGGGERGGPGMGGGQGMQGGGGPGMRGGGGPGGGDLRGEGGFQVQRQVTSGALAELGVTEAELVAAMKAEIDELEAAKTITAEQADRMRTGVELRAKMLTSAADPVPAAAGETAPAAEDAA